MEKTTEMSSMTGLSSNIQVVRPKTDDEPDETLAIKEAFQQAIANQCVAVYFPAKEDAYRLSETIRLEGTQKLKIFGAGMAESQIDINLNEPVFYVTKNTKAGKQAQNISFEGLTLQQKIVTDTPSKTCIYVEHATQVSFYQMSFIKSTSALIIKHSSYVSIDECVTQQMSCSHITIGEGTSNIRISETCLDTWMSEKPENPANLANSENPKRYALLLIAPTSDASQDEEAIKNITIENCEFLNNLNGKGIEAYGVTNILISSNLIENCSLGVLIGCENETKMTLPSHQIKIVLNKVTQGTANIGYSGIIVIGGQESTTARMGTALGGTVLILGNIIRGFGSNDYATIGGLTIRWAQHVIVQNNIVANATRIAFAMKYVVTSQVCDNQFLNTIRSINPTANATTVPVVFHIGCYSVDFYTNKLVNSPLPPLSYGVYNQNARGMANYFDNTILSTHQKYQVQNAQMNGITDLSKRTDYKIGLSGESKVKTQDGQILQVCNSDNGLTLRSDGAENVMTATGEKTAQEGDGLTSEVTFSGTILDHLALNEEFELELSEGKVTFTLLELKNGKVGIVAPEIPETFTDVSVNRIASTWKEY